MASKMPMTPPMQPSTTASIKNCISTSRAVAPIAKRTPISRVRSVTDTNMIFMMPMPPTSRLTAATAPSNAVMICVVEATFSATSAVSRIEKLSSSPSDKDRRSRIRSRTSPLRCTRSLCGSMLMRIVLTRLLPIKRRAAVLNGMTTRSSWSPPIAAVPFSLRSPTMRQENELTRSISPITGAPGPNNSFWMVVPITQTAAPDISSAGSKNLPSASVRLSVVK